MMQAIQKTVILVTVATMTAAPVWAATDYSSMSNEELSQIRGTMRNANQEERDAFRSEWQHRSRNMTQEERQQYTNRPANAAADGTGMQKGNGQGGGGRGKGRRGR